MPLEIVRNDITKMKVDAIVNAANTSLLGGGGVDGAIHRAAGRELLEECKGLGGCNVGEAKATKGYNLPCKHVIHTVGPIWQGGLEGEEGLLTACYRNSLRLAKELGCESVAFPLISTGVYGYPKDKGLNVAVSTIGEFLLENEMTVYIVVFDRDSYQLSGRLFSDIATYINDRYVDENMDAALEASRAMYLREEGYASGPGELESDVYFDLDGALSHMEDTFSRRLLRLIDERELTDAACYKRANIDRRLFSKIRNNRDYHPKKTTVLAFAIALELSLKETKELLACAGYALSHSSKGDIIVEYFIEKGVYNIFEINEILFAFDQSLLGG